MLFVAHCSRSTCIVVLKIRTRTLPTARDEGLHLIVSQERKRRFQRRKTSLPRVAAIAVWIVRAIGRRSNLSIANLHIIASHRSTLGKRRVFGSEHHYGVGRTLDRAGAALE